MLRIVQALAPRLQYPCYAFSSSDPFKKFRRNKDQSNTVKLDTPVPPKEDKPVVEDKPKTSTSNNTESTIKTSSIGSDHPEERKNISWASRTHLKKYGNVEIQKKTTIIPPSEPTVDRNAQQKMADQTKMNSSSKVTEPQTKLKSQPIKEVPPIIKPDQIEQETPIVNSTQKTIKDSNPLEDNKIFSNFKVRSSKSPSNNDKQQKEPSLKEEQPTMKAKIIIQAMSGGADSTDKAPNSNKEQISQKWSKQDQFKAAYEKFKNDPQQSPKGKKAQEEGQPKVNGSFYRKMIPLALIIAFAGNVGNLAYWSWSSEHTPADVQSMFQCLAEGNVAQTHSVIVRETGHQEKPVNTYRISFRTKDNINYYAQSNQEINSQWLSAIRSYNERVSTDPNSLPILVRAEKNFILTSKLETLKTALSYYLIFLIYKSFKFATAQMGRKGGRSNGFGEMFGGEAKSRRLRKTVNVNFSQVVGMQKAKEEIVEFIDFLVKPDKYKKLGARIPRGALLTGPPGTGKTMLAKACAGEAQVPFFTVSGSQFMEMYVGVGASRVRSLFEEAKAAAPSIIFIDEIDAIGKKRTGGASGGGHDQRDTTLNQLLIEMDGFNTENNVVVFAATNKKEVLDPALLRPGRFDRILEVDLPDMEGRRQIFIVHLGPILLQDETKKPEYARRLATLTPNFSGAEIKNLCNEAAINAARSNRTYVTMLDFQLASERMIGGVERKSSLITPETKRTVAFHECGHGVVSWFLEKASPLLKMTIIPRSKGALGFAQYLPNASQVMTLQELEDQVCVILGGRVSEEHFFGSISTGAQDDLQKAYQTAKDIVTRYGMAKELGWLGYTETEYAKNYSKQTQRIIDQQIAGIISRCTERTRNLVKEKQIQIRSLAEVLLEKETIDQVEIQNVLGPRPFKSTDQYEKYASEKRKLSEAVAE